MGPFANVTLKAFGGDLSVTVFLPWGIRNEEAFYYSSRFDHGSMIGSIKRKIRRLNKNNDLVEYQHELFGGHEWRQPHNSEWPESGIGLASEFGVGDDGAFCNYRCGWQQVNDVSNGLLGYQEALNGETFLKIGVGELVKGTCPTCDSTGDYKFNSPYHFAQPPLWKLSQQTDNAVRLEHEAKLRSYGYKLVKEITLSGNVLSVTSTLTNTGSQAFSTAWYSHNFFSCDEDAVGPGYSVDLNLKGNRPDLYDEPGTWSWSSPLTDYASVEETSSSIRVKMNKALDPGVRIKSEFTNDGATNGGFTIKACETLLTSSIPQVEEPTRIPMYAYNLYIERGTFSPEPMILIQLDAGATKTWTQQLVVSDSKLGEMWASDQYRAANVVPENAGHVGGLIIIFFAAVVTSVTLLFKGNQKRQKYTELVDSQDLAQEEI